MFQMKMFEQNHQTLQMIVQVFGHLHRDQIGLVREEFIRLGQLSEELLALQREWSRYPAVPEKEKVGQPPRPALNGPEVSASPATVYQNEGGTSSEQREKPVSTWPAGAPSILIPPSISNPEDIHVWLVERMTALETERQTLWGRVCSALRMT